jgi:SAM-dependent methyltransferase
MGKGSANEDRQPDGLFCGECDVLFESWSETVVCPGCNTSYALIRGIPRFVTDDHLESFAHQWNRYEVAQLEEDQATFQAKTGVSLDELKGLRILDAGCGGGRYCRVAGKAGATVVGADHTTAVDKAAILCNDLPNVSFVQADLNALPLEQASFDFVFSIGVMHHDADTRAVFENVAQMVKPGGRMAVWLYCRNQWWQEWMNNILRRRTTKMSPERLERWCRFGAALGAIPLVKSTLNKLISFSAHPVKENRLCDTFDWYAPLYQHHHTVEELTGWFHESGFENLAILPPEKQGRLYRWAYERNLLIGSGVNVLGTRKSDGETRP